MWVSVHTAALDRRGPPHLRLRPEECTAAAPAAISAENVSTQGSGADVAGADGTSTPEATTGNLVSGRSGSFGRGVSGR